MKASGQLVTSLLAFGICAVYTAAARATPVVIDFDDRPGFPGPFLAGTAVPAQYMVDDEYLGLGVRFGSGGGGIYLGSPNNPVSAPNVAGATDLGPVISFSSPVVASFWVGSVNGVVDSASVTLTQSSGTVRFQAFDLSGVFLGSVAGRSLETLTLSFPGQIHNVRISQDNPIAFDNFTFDGLAPEPGTLSLAVVGMAVFRPLRRN